MQEFSLRVGVCEELFDVVVAGGGLTGVCAASAAAREGAKVLILEGTGALGGMATQGFVPGWCGAHNSREVIHSGLSRKIIASSWDRGVSNNLTDRQWSIESEKLKRACDEIVLGSGAKLLFNTTVAGVDKDGGIIKAVYIANKAGIQAVQAKVFVDCTGDADLAAWSGVAFAYGDEEGDVQPASLCYILANVDYSKLEGDSKANPGWPQRVIDDPEFDLIRDNYLGNGRVIFDNVNVCNAGHLWNVDNTDPVNITQAMVDGRKLAWQIFTAVKRELPNTMANASLVCTAPLMGVRETRRIEGDYTLTADDYWARRRFEDEIAFNCFFIDIHPSLKKRELERAGKWSWTDEKQNSRYGEGEFHAIPYRSLLPKGVDNLLVAGRSISADRETLSAVRVMPPCMSMGEAAGIAAASAASGNNGRVREIDITYVQKVIRDNDGFMPLL